MYCFVDYLNVSFYNSEYTLINTNMKQFQGLHKTVHLLQNKLGHFDHILITFLNCLVFCAVFSGSSDFWNVKGFFESNVMTCWVQNSLS